MNDPNFGGVVVDDDPTDDAIRFARANAMANVAYLLAVVSNDRENTADRIRAAESLLGVAGCLSL